MKAAQQPSRTAFQGVIMSPQQPRNRFARALLAALAIVAFGARLEAQTQPTRPQSPAQPPAAKTNTAQRNEVVNLNTADQAELARLPGIGPAKAKAIVELRMRIKAFVRLEQLMRVRGIGRKTFRRLQPMLTLAGPTTLLAKARGTGASDQNTEIGPRRK
jgi:competence protein ComEA